VDEGASLSYRPQPPADTGDLALVNAMDAVVRAACRAIARNTPEVTVHTTGHGDLFRRAWEMLLTAHELADPRSEALRQTYLIASRRVAVTRGTAS
jgi:hypothetical protein